MPTTLPKIPSQYRWRVNHRLRVLAYAGAHSLKAASRHFGLERKTIRRWRDRYRAQGVLGLVPRYPNAAALAPAGRDPAAD